MHNSSVNARQALEGQGHYRAAVEALRAGAQPRVLPDESLLKLRSDAHVFAHVRAKSTQVAALPSKASVTQG